MLFGIMLSGLIASPTVLAQECSICDLNASVNDLKGTVDLKLDYKNSEMAQSIINYLAQAEQDRYTLMVMWHTDPAPGTDMAMTAGKQLGLFSLYGSSVIAKVGDRLVEGLGVTSTSGVPQKNPESLIYEQLKGYFDTAVTDPSNTNLKREKLAGLNFANLYHNAAIPINDPSANLLINLISDPFPTRVSVPGEDDAVGKENVATAAIEKAVMSVGLNTLVDMLAKRTPNTSADNKSMLQIMEKESTWRHQDVNWYKNISLSSQEAVLREIAQMMAFNLYMNYQQYRQNEQIAAMMAASVAAQARLASTMATMSKILAGTEAAVKAAAAEAAAQQIELQKDVDEAQ